MSRSIRRISKVAAAAAVAVWAAAAVAAPQAHPGREATLPQAAYRITNWGFDGYKGLWVEAGQHSYYGEFLSPCLGAVPDHIIFRFNPDGSLNRFSQVIVPRERRVCVFKSFQAGIEPQFHGRSQEAG